MTHIHRAGRHLPLLAALLLAGSRAGAQSLPTPQQLGARHDSIVGGRAAIERYRSMHLTGNFSIPAGGIEAPQEMLRLKPNKYLFRATLGPAGEVVTGFDGQNAWGVQPGRGAALITGAQAEQVADQADFFSMLHDYSRYAKVETLDEVEFEGKRSYRVQMTRASGEVLYEYFDVATGLSAGGSSSVESQMGKVELKSIFSDYKEFGGATLATRIVQRNPQFDIIMTITAVVFDTLDEAAFAPPDAVKALIKPALDAELAEHFKGITLTDEQVGRILAIKARHHAAMDALKQGAKDPTDAATKAEMQKHMGAEHAEFMKVLTPDQVKVFEENMKAHHMAEPKPAARKP